MDPRLNPIQRASVCNRRELKADYNALSRIAASFHYSAQKYRNYIPLLRLIFITFHHLQNLRQRAESICALSCGWLYYFPQKKMKPRFH